MADETDEITWIKNNLVPLMRRMGFRKIDITHGVLEAGRDVVFADYDRFGLLRYYGAQVKRGSLRAANETQELRTIIAQVTTAYETPYRDIATGTEHKLSGVYLIIDGDVTDAARHILFGKTGGWFHIVDQNQLEIAKRIVSFMTDEERRIKLRCFAIELETNGFLAEDIFNGVDTFLSRESEEKAFRLPRRTFGVRAYDQVFEIAYAEFDPENIADLAEYEDDLQALNLFIQGLRIGGIERESLEKSLKNIKNILQRFLQRIKTAKQLIDYISDSERPAPGHRLPKFGKSE
jgi:hypothetical protein